MARFRAFESDSSSGSEDEVENQQESEKPQSSVHDEEEELELEDESDAEGELEESSESDDGSSDILEDELIHGNKAKSRPRTALLQDEHGDFQVTGDDEDSDIQEGSRSASSRSSPEADPRALGPGSNIIPWARHVGVDAQKMHVMQTSLFRMPEEAAALKALNQPASRPKTVAALNFPNPALNRKHSRDSDGDGLRSDSRERASFAHDIEPAVLRPSRKYARVEIASSIANDREGDYVDAGLAFGRSFRVGWGPGGTLVHSGSICSPFASPSSSANSSTITVTKTPFPSAKPRTSPESSRDTSPSAVSEKLLQHHLSHTPISKNTSGVPFANLHQKATPTPLNFASFASLFPTTDTAGPAPLFRLGSVLFDPIDLRLGSRKQGTSLVTGATLITPDLRNRVTLLNRRYALSDWLEHVVKPSVDGDIRVKAAGPISGNYSTADTVFTQLTGHQISEACTIAMDAGYLKLATLISQAGGDRTFKADIQAQLQIWRDEKLGPSTGGGGLAAGPKGLISRGVWKVYRLLSGPDDQVDDATLGSWVEEVCSGLDWKRIFGLCLWYGMGVDAAVSDVVRLYESLTRRYTSTMVARPRPQWQLEQQNGRQPSTALLGSGHPALGLFSSTSTAPPSQHQPEDPQYSLIRLHADPALSLSQSLDPLSYGPDERRGGVGMCWHLYIILARVMRVRDFADRTQTASSKAPSRPNGIANGFHGTGESSDSDEGSAVSAADPALGGHSHTANLLTSAYAFELESWGMVQEAAFVLLHLEAGEGRRKAIKDLLARSAPQMDDWMTRGLVGSLKLPITWVNEAKAMHALDQGNVYNAYELYLSAQLWNSAHDLAVLELAPDAILRRDIDLLRDLIEPFDLDGRRDKIDGWFVRGKVFVDYVNIITRLPQLQEQLQADPADLDGIVPVGEQSTAEEIEDLTRRVPKLIALLPDVLHRPRSMDDRHAAAIEEMTRSLLSVMGKAKPAMLLKQPLLGFMDGSTKISLIRGKSYARFLQKVAA